MLALAFCEPANAVALGPEHLRRLGDGAPPHSAPLAAGTRALCERDLHAGWDLPGTTTWPDIEHAAQPRPHDQRPWICSPCHQQALTQYAPAPTPPDGAP